jgi:hypothetical protein
MTDKERILMIIITRIIPALVYSFSFEKREEYIESCMLDPSKLQSGDLVFANTSIMSNDFMVGFVESVEPNYVVIREIGSNRLCNYSNESFTKINKEKLGYEILEGIQYKIYLKVLKAFSEYTGYTIRFKKIYFEDHLCYVEGRKMFENDTQFSICFPFNSKTTIKEIGNKLKDAESLIIQS